MYNLSKSLCNIISKYTPDQYAVKYAAGSIDVIQTSEDSSGYLASLDGEFL